MPSDHPDRAFDRPDIGPVDFMTECMRDRTLSIGERMLAARHLAELFSLIPHRNIFDQMAISPADIECLAQTIKRWTREVVVNHRRDDIVVKSNG
jgi:hypothetical protein